MKKSSARRQCRGHGRKDRRQAQNRQALLLLSEITLLAATGLFLLTGCGGGSSSGGGVQTPAPASSLTKR